MQRFQDSGEYYQVHPLVACSGAGIEDACKLNQCEMVRNGLGAFSWGNQHGTRLKILLSLAERGLFGLCNVMDIGESGRTGF